MSEISTLPQAEKEEVCVQFQLTQINAYLDLLNPLWSIMRNIMDYHVYFKM